jgi:hypothetical protein
LKKRGREGRTEREKLKNKDSEREQRRKRAREREEIKCVSKTLDYNSALLKSNMINNSANIG